MALIGTIYLCIKNKRVLLPSLLNFCFKFIELTWFTAIKLPEQLDNALFVNLLTNSLLNWTDISGLYQWLLYGVT